MTEYNKKCPELDFIIRTREIICQYEQYVPKSKKHREATLLINCLLGLLVLPKERSLLEHIPKEPIKKLEGWGLKLEHISILKDTKERDKLTLKSVIRHMRNSVAHFNLKTHAEGENGQITHLEFWDYPPKSYERLETLPQQVKFPNSLKDNIHYDLSRKCLIFKKVMDERTKNKLLNISTDPRYREAINKLSKKARINFKVKIPVEDLRDFVKRLTEPYHL